MSLTLQQTYTAVAANITSSFQGYGGTPPYTYSVSSGGAGGTIGASTGVYTAPAVASTDPNNAYDTVVVTDATSATASAQILVGTPLALFCDIIQTSMGLSSDQIWMWEQKIFIPKDSRLYIAVSEPTIDIQSNSNATSTVNTTGLNQSQALSASAIIDVDILSRGPAARDLKGQVVLATYSTYSQQQQEANYFTILRNGNNFINLSGLDGTAIPYRYRISFTLLYLESLISAGQYFDTFLPIQTNAS